MTHRDRHNPEEASAREAARTTSAGRSESASSSTEASVWAEWYQRASPSQQQEALRLAAQQGILFAHRLAAPAHAAAPPRSLLAGLLNGQIKEMEPLRPPPLEFQDNELDHTQREAVARATATPDVCLIQGYPGTGKSRVIAEIILQAALRGERILFLAPNTSALDRVLERVGTHPAVCPLRCLAADETVPSLTPTVARLTLPERLRAYQETTAPAARKARDAARQALHACREEQAHWTRLVELATNYEKCGEQLRLLSERRANLAAEVEDGHPIAPPIRPRWEQAERTRMQSVERLDSQLAGLQAELETIRGKQNHWQSEWEAIRPLEEARQGRRFWTGSWWRAVMRGGLSQQVSDLQARRTELKAGQQQLEQGVATLQRERAEIENRWTTERRGLLDEEIARRQSEVDAEIAKVAGEQETLREQGHSICRRLHTGEAVPEISVLAVTSARADWERRCKQCEQQALSAEQWMQTVEEGVRLLPDKLAGWANLIASATTTLAGDSTPLSSAKLGGEKGLSAPAALFDLLILDEAHQVTESEFASAARRARRWVLLGEPQLETESAAAPRKVVRPIVPRPGFFERLWRSLHADPSRLPLVWMQSKDRLICRLRSTSSEQQKWIETEPVVDRPEIELRILSAPRQPPQIVEVQFPASIAIGEAKQFIFHELEELAVQTGGRSMDWSETSEDVILEMAPCGDAETVAVPLAIGVHEKLARLPISEDGAAESRIPWHTSSFQFSRAEGWTRQLAEQWISQRLGLRSLERTALLTVFYRLDAPLGRFLSDLLFGGICQPVSKTESRILSSRPPVEFVAVPSLASLENRSRVEADRRWQEEETGSAYGERGQAALSVRSLRLRTVKGGAGLELDLNDNRPLEPLPADVRARLPRQGLVNYLEARALVKYLEGLVQEEEFRRACEHWRHCRLWPCEQGCASPSDCACPDPNNGPAVAVMALYPAQVDLLRHLIQQSPALTSSSISIAVGLPSAFYHRECLLSLVSLTRSHTHRAVSYGDHPQTLAQALTRGASGLILFGDPGTLARRSQWQGPLDHLDESASQREGRLVSQLVHYLQGYGPHASAFHLREGSSV